MTLTEEARLIESRHPGWHFWHSDEHKWYATHVWIGPLGCGVTLAVPHMTAMDNRIAEWEHALACARRREAARLTFTEAA